MSNGRLIRHSFCRGSVQQIGQGAHCQGKEQPRPTAGWQEFKNLDSGIEDSQAPLPLNAVQTTEHTADSSPDPIGEPNARS